MDEIHEKIMRQKLYIQARRKHFSVGRAHQSEGLGDGSPPAGSRGRAPVGSGGEAPRS